MTRLEMRVNAHLSRFSTDVVFAGAFRPRHTVIPLFHIGSDKIEDSGQWWDEKISDIVVRIDA
jgi:hypothetical protein